MKKLSILFACLVAVLSLNSCKEDTDPQYNDPTEFKLNTPALASQYYELTADGTLDLSWSQPNYGYAAAAVYKVSISLLEDFSEAKELTSEYKLCYAQIPGSEIAEAICNLRGIESEDDYTDEPARAVYFRVSAKINGIEGSEIVSNVIKIDQVKEYCAIQSPGFIYVVGAFTGWTGPDAGAAGHYADFRLFESANAIGSKVYTGIFDIPAGQAMFRFYTALTGWDADSYGSQTDDSPIDCVLDGGVYNGPIVKGKGSFNFPDWAGGKMKITVNMNNKSVIIEEGGVDTSNSPFIYLVGAPSGWTGPSADNAAHYEAWKLFDVEGNGVYVGTFQINAGEFMFRFYKELTGWDAASFGSQVEDNPIDIALTDGVYTGAATDGKGSWNCPDWAGGKVEVKVDMKNLQVTFTQK